MARTKKTMVKDLFITRTVERSTMTFPVLDMATMQGKMEKVTLPGKYRPQEAMAALIEKGYIPAGMPTIEADNVVLRWRLSDIMGFAETLKDVPPYVEGEEE